MNTRHHKEIAALATAAVFTQRNARIYLDERAVLRRIEAALVEAYPNLILVKLMVKK